MKRRFHLARVRYFGTAKTQTQMCRAALGMNLLKAHRKLELMELGGRSALKGQMAHQTRRSTAKTCCGFRKNKLQLRGKPCWMVSERLCSNPDTFSTWMRKISN